MATPVLHAVCLVVVVGLIDAPEEFEAEVHHQVEKVVDAKKAKQEDKKPEMVSVYELGES